MPLSPLQRRLLAAIAAQRDPESYIGGGTALHRHGIRGSSTEIRFKARYQDYQLDSVHLLNPMTAAELNRGLFEATACAERLVAALPRGLPYGLLLAQDGSLARPDPDRPETLVGLTVHHGRQKGSWPSSPEIGSIMLRERHA